ncbi:hypothetical protein AWB68_08740 [Caballeronia choica]|uniref:Uncharacterized protein n=2 Tax=Caballeronia choica TaxID=326476 RepID=A0A158L4P8_9BURK|nr:hypothetical protein AWB68_08740 [Caballeronia choica]
MRAEVFAIIKRVCEPILNRRPFTGINVDEVGDTVAKLLEPDPANWSETWFWASRMQCREFANEFLVSYKSAFDAETAILVAKDHFDAKG